MHDLCPMTFESPLYATNACESPLYATNAFESPLYATNAFESPLYATNAFESPLYATNAFFSNLIHLLHFKLFCFYFYFIFSMKANNFHVTRMTSGITHQFNTEFELQEVNESVYELYLFLYFIFPLFNETVFSPIIYAHKNLRFSMGTSLFCFSFNFHSVL